MSRQPKKYAIDDIRSRFQTVAIDNRYQVFMKPNMTIYNAAAEAGVTRRFVDEDLGLYASDAVLPGSSFADIEVVGDRQGITERMPFGRIYDDVTFTFMVDKDYLVMRFFEAWMQQINPLHSDSGSFVDFFGNLNTSVSAQNAVTSLNYPKDYKIDLSIVKFNKDMFMNGGDSGSALFYNFLQAWPLSVASTPVNYDSGSVLKLNVTFRYTRYVMEDITKVLQRSGWKGYSDSFDPWIGKYDSFMPTAKPTKSVTKPQTIAGTNVEDIGKGFYNVHTKKGDGFDWSRLNPKNWNWKLKKPSNWNIKQSTSPNP